MTCWPNRQRLSANGPTARRAHCPPIGWRSPSSTRARGRARCACMPQVRGRKSCSPPSPPYDEAMTSTITCPHCGLAQEPAYDSVCRGCANPIAGVVAPAKSVLGLGKAVAAKALPLGARVAGVVLLLNAGANVLSMIKEGAGTGPLANQEVKGMIVDLVVGGGLLAGRATLQKWAIVRVVLGLIVFGAMFGAQHVMIMGEAVEPTLRINQDKFERAVIDEMKGRLTKFENLGREPLPGGAMLHLRGHAKTLDLEYYRGLFAYGNRGYQVVAFATPKSFARAEPELAAMVRSFQPACQGGPVTAR